MQSSRKPRRVFAAPLVMIAAMPAACIVKSSDPDPKQPETRDHRDPDPKVRDNRDGTPTDPVITNPPPPTDPVTQVDPQPDPDVGDPQEPQPNDQGTDAPSYRREWTVSLQDDGSCEAYYHVECKKGRTCNPPPPKKMAKCPDGITMDRPIKIYSPENSGVCYIEPPSAKCPEKATCNPPPPKKTSCPS